MATDQLDVNETLYLSGFRWSDCPALVQYLNCRAIYDRTLRIPFPYTEAEADAWIVASQESSTQWAIRNKNGDLMGGCGLAISPLAPHRAEIGYWLGQPFWGAGTMSAVVVRVCAHAFAELNLDKLKAQVFPENHASARVLEKAGFVQEGYLRNHHRKDGKLIDSRLFGLVRPGN